MDYHCFKCGKALQLGTAGFVGRKDECAHCKADLHCCKNCAHFDANAYNGCTESQAERVLEKDRSNFCDYFTFRQGTASGAGVSKQKDNALAQLDALFKK